MAYTKRQREMRQCGVIKSNGERCKGFAKIGGERCSLHSYEHRRELPKTKTEREAARYRRAKKRAGNPRRAVCNCPAYPYTHRLSSGACRYPDKPLNTFIARDVEPLPVAEERRLDRGDYRAIEEETLYEAVMSKVWSGKI